MWFHFHQMHESIYHTSTAGKILNNNTENNISVIIIMIVIYFYCDFYFPCFGVRLLLTVPVYFTIQFFSSSRFSAGRTHIVAHSLRNIYPHWKHFHFFFSLSFRKLHNFQCCIAVWAVWRKWTKNSLFVRLLCWDSIHMSPVFCLLFYYLLYFRVAFSALVLFAFSYSLASVSILLVELTASYPSLPSYRYYVDRHSWNFVWYRPLELFNNICIQYAAEYFASKDGCRFRRRKKINRKNLYWLRLSIIYESILHFFLFWLFCHWMHSFPFIQITWESTLCTSVVLPSHFLSFDINPLLRLIV